MISQPSMPEKLWQISKFTLICFLIDQISKWIILEQVMQPPRVIGVTPFFNLTLSFNTGVSFGFFKETLAEWPAALTAAKGLIIAGLVIWASLTNSRVERIGLAMMAGGAIGNTLDRWRQGAVTDFLDFHWANWHWPTFNMADVAIAGGTGLIFLAVMLPTKMMPPASSPAEGPRQE